MRLGPKIVLVAAILCGGLAAYLASGWLRAKPVKSPEALSQVTVIVAAREISPGSHLTPDLLRLVPWPRELVPAGALSEPEKVQGRVTRLPLMPGEVILEGKLAPIGAQGGMAGVLAEGKRAFTIRVDEASGVAGFATPGNRVDVLLTLDRQEFKADPITKIILQNVLILGVGQEMVGAKPGEKPKLVPTVTLEVTPAEGEKLALAAKEGHLSLALRGWQDPLPIATSGIRLSSLMQDGTAKDPRSSNSQPQEQPGVEVIRGLQRQVERF